MSKKPLEEAPFHIYLKILEAEGYGEEAKLIKEFYINLLTTVDLGDEKQYTEEQVMKTPYMNLVAAAELIIEQAGREIGQFVPAAAISGKAILGKGAEKLSPDSLQKLIFLQAQSHEEEKLRLANR